MGCENSKSSYIKYLGGAGHVYVVVIYVEASSETNKTSDYKL